MSDIESVYLRALDLFNEKSPIKLEADQYSEAVRCAIGENGDKLLIESAWAHIAPTAARIACADNSVPTVVATLVPEHYDPSLDITFDAGEEINFNCSLALEALLSYEEYVSMCGPDEIETFVPDDPDEEFCDYIFRKSVELGLVEDWPDSFTLTLSSQWADYRDWKRARLDAIDKSNVGRRKKRWENSLNVVNEFLAENEQFGDDWSHVIEDINEIIDYFQKKEGEPDA